MEHENHQHIIDSIKCYSVRLEFRTDRPNLCDRPIDDEELVHALSQAGLPEMTPIILGNYLHLLIAHANEELLKERPRFQKTFWSRVTRSVAARPDVGGFFVPGPMAKRLVREVVRARERYEDSGEDHLSEQMRSDREKQIKSIQISEGAVILCKRLGTKATKILGEGLWEGLYDYGDFSGLDVDEEMCGEVDAARASARTELAKDITHAGLKEAWEEKVGWEMQLEGMTKEQLMLKREGIEKRLQQRHREEALESDNVSTESWREADHDFDSIDASTVPGGFDLSLSSVNHPVDTRGNAISNRQRNLSVTTLDSTLGSAPGSPRIATPRRARSSTPSTSNEGGIASGSAPRTPAMNAANSSPGRRRKRSRSADEGDGTDTESERGGKRSRHH